ncbi:uncharacterized protein LOC110421019 isoform X2 [Herrania umbratica]|uniref:Uncharacterized protein LOC110421019 isoform X2 n=1 Tax=Herrania umbratica TaxID=108875 RepID=A0A6J1AT99_9ROSI|nr:uncharacterized protein LOC110421019 isoform X2 [Herrania umbratica]
MAGPNPPKQPSSFTNHRKSRWESSSSIPNKNHSSTTNDPKSSTKPKPSPKTGPSPSPATQNKSQSDPNPALPPIPFPDLAALGPPPPPAYGFHMLERRTIVLYDGSVRSYFALPSDYQEFPTRPLLVPPDFGSPPLGFRDNRDYWNGPGDGPGPFKRKYGEEEKDLREEKKEEFARQRHGHPNAKVYSSGPGGPDRLAGTSSPFRNEEMRAAKYMRVGGGFENNNLGFNNKHLEVDQNALKKAFLHFVKAVFENAAQKKNYLEDGKQGRLPCFACGRSSKDFPDMHGLIMHTYYSDNADLRVDHLGLYKALCVLMGWNYSKPPDNSKVYRFLPADEAAANQEDLIMWPPVVIVHNTITGKSKDGRMEGLGNKAMDSKLRDLGFGSGKSKSMYGREGHLGITVVKFAGDQSGLKDAVRLAEYFEEENRGRKGWSRVQPLTFGKDDEKNPSLVKVDERTGEKRRIFYGYLGTVADLDKVDFDMRKRVVIESRREYKGPR